MNKKTYLPIKRDNIVSKSSTKQSGLKTIVSTKSVAPKVPRSVIASWVLHALKIILGDESIRQEILLHYFPDLHHGNTTKLKKGSKYHIRTFDAFIESGKTREDKYKKIKSFLTEVIKLKGVVVFTATNVQRDEEDNETHFQTFIVDNDKQKVYIIDPAYNINVVVGKGRKKDKNILVSGQGIYYAEIAHDVIKPFFEENTDYIVEFVRLSHPAQIIEDDVFCQSWSLFILIQLLENDAYRSNQIFSIPDEQIDKYNMILKFYKKLFTDIPNMSIYLSAEYNGEVSDCDDCPSDKLLNINPSDFLLSMTKNDMVDE